MMRTLCGRATALLLLALSIADVAPLGIARAAACEMCARRCCCRPAAGGEGCRMSRSCGGKERDAAVPTSRSGEGILAGPLPSPIRPAAAGRLRTVDLSLPAGHVSPPPVPPPRPFHG